LLQEAWKLVAEATTQAQSLWQKPSKFQPYKKGDQVWLEGNNLQLTHPMVNVTAWLPRPGIRTYIFLAGLPTLLARSMTSYLALYP
jgi:hypothetical protein